ncbi:unnamed protein product, partial [Closterium sp. Naga37s-1]
FSGITPQMLAGVTTTLQQAQTSQNTPAHCSLFLLFSPHPPPSGLHPHPPPSALPLTTPPSCFETAETILVGHSTESDLHAIRAVHLRVIDTSLLFPHPRGPPFKCALRFLAADYLGRTIQAGWWAGRGGVEGRGGRGRRGGMRGGLRGGGWSFHRGGVGAGSGGADGAASSSSSAAAAAAAAAGVATAAVAAAGAASGYRRSNTWCRNAQKPVAAAPPATAAGGVGGDGEVAANGVRHETANGGTTAGGAAEEATAAAGVAAAASEGAAAREGAEATEGAVAREGAAEEQQGTVASDSAGHDSVEDARAALDLALLKIQHGPHFGLPRRASKLHHTENILTRLSASGRHCTVVLHAQAARPDLFLGGNSNSTSEILCLKHGDLGKVASREACKPLLNLLAATFPSLMASLSARCSSIASMPRLAAALASEPVAEPASMPRATNPASKRTPELAPKPASPPQLETAKEQRQAQQQQMDQQQFLAPTHPADCAVEESSRKVDAQVGLVHESLPPNTLLLVLTGCGDTPAVRRMMEWRWKRQQWRSTGMEPWDEHLDALLIRMQERASAALCLATVKQ